MPLVDSELAPLRDPALAALATGAWPVWLWSVDGSRIFWANAAGAAVFGAANVAALGQRRFQANDAAAGQVVRLGATLPARGQQRLERLRGFGAGFGRALTCLCSRIVLADGRAAVLIIAAEAAGPSLSLGERVARLFAESQDCIAAFGADGALVHANAAAAARLGGATTLAALGLAALTVPDAGSVQTCAQLGGANVGLSAERLGKDESRVLLLTLARQPAQSPQTPRAAIAAEPAAVPPPVLETASVAATEPLVASPSIEPEAEPVPEGPACVQETTAEPSSEQPSAAVSPREPDAERPPGPHETPAALRDEPIVERRHPLRFVWNMDAEGRFVVGSDEFMELVGPRTMAAVGRPWREIANELNLDPEDQVARAVATQETWSGIVVSWPVDDSSERLPVELSGLPVFDRDRTFRGYRGFGVCRDLERINALSRERHERPAETVEPTPEPPQHIEDETALPPPAQQQAPHEEAAAEAAAEVPEEAPAEVTAEMSEPTGPERPILSITPASANVVPFRQQQASEPKTPPALSAIERRAFRELAQELTARLRSEAVFDERGRSDGARSETSETHETPVPSPAEAPPAAGAALERTLLDRIPIGVLLYRHDALIYANRHFLDWSGYGSLEAIEQSGGLNALFAGPVAARPAENNGPQKFAIRAQSGRELPTEGRMLSVPWQGSSAQALVLTDGSSGTLIEKLEHARAAAERESHALKSLLDKVSDGIVMLDAQGVIAGANARAAALFGKLQDEMTGHLFGEFLAPESERVAREYFERVASGADGEGTAIDIAARVGENRLVPLALSVTRIGPDHFAAMFHDIAASRQTEEELREAKRQAAQATAAKNEFLAKLSHDIRTPLNAITGFAEVIMAERFGPIGNERYREYLKDIHAAGTHLVALLNDLVDLSRIENGKAELNFANISLNALTQQCVGIMQPQANKARIIIRTALTPALPQVVADERSMRQIVLNLLSNSIRLTGPGGQVIVSTAYSDAHEAVLRVRDTGAGMSEKEIQAAMEPFRQTATSDAFGSGGTGFGLPLTKAIAEANRAHFSISSAPNAGTLVEIAFPPHRVVAE
jgi:PAS domain S-box-containing protein